MQRSVDLLLATNQGETRALLGTKGEIRLLLIMPTESRAAHEEVTKTCFGASAGVAS